MNKDEIIKPRGFRDVRTCAECKYEKEEIIELPEWEDFELKYTCKKYPGYEVGGFTVCDEFEEKEAEGKDNA